MAWGRKKSTWPEAATRQKVPVKDGVQRRGDGMEDRKDRTKTVDGTWLSLPTLSSTPIEIG